MLRFNAGRMACRAISFAAATFFGGRWACLAWPPAAGGGGAGFCSAFIMRPLPFHVPLGGGSNSSCNRDISDCRAIILNRLSSAAFYSSVLTSYELISELDGELARGSYAAGSGALPFPFPTGRFVAGSFPLAAAVAVGGLSLMEVVGTFRADLSGRLPGRWMGGSSLRLGGKLGPAICACVEGGESLRRGGDCLRRGGAGLGGGGDGEEEGGGEGRSLSQSGVGV
mgnify:FL=1